MGPHRLRSPWKRYTSFVGAEGESTYIACGDGVSAVQKPYVQNTNQCFRVFCKVFGDFSVYLGGDSFLKREVTFGGIRT